MTRLINIMLSLAIFSLGYSELRAAEWGYRNDDGLHDLPSQWAVKYPLCGGSKQSPIDINFTATTYNSTLNFPPLTIVQTTDTTGTPEVWTIEDNGHSLSLVSDKEYTFTSLNSEVFKMLGLHFHWRGSEHYYNGQKLAAEIHLVHQSVTDPAKLSVIGFLMNTAREDNPKLTPIINKIKDVRKYQAKTNSTDFKLDYLVQTTFSDYFRYDGSLTTPTCDEIVAWILVDNPIIGISENQLLELQSLQEKTNGHITTNSRPIQNLNGRTVYRSFESISAVSGVLSRKITRKTRKMF